jgi:hypothetical protein
VTAKGARRNKVDKVAMALWWNWLDATWMTEHIEDHRKVWIDLKVVMMLGKIVDVVRADEERSPARLANFPSVIAPLSTSFGRVTKSE